MQPLKIWKVEAEDDAVYIEAFDIADAKRILYHHMGEIPDNLLTWCEVRAIPEGEEALPSVRED